MEMQALIFSGYALRALSGGKEVAQACARRAPPDLRPFLFRRCHVVNLLSSISRVRSPVSRSVLAAWGRKKRRSVVLTCSIARPGHNETWSSQRQKGEEKGVRVR